MTRRNTETSRALTVRFYLSAGRWGVEDQSSKFAIQIVIKTQNSDIDCCYCRLPDVRENTCTSNRIGKSCNEHIANL